MTVLPVDHYGMVDPQQVAGSDSAQYRTRLGDAMRTMRSGTINPIQEIAEICRRRKVLFHTDASTGNWEVRR